MSDTQASDCGKPGVSCVPGRDGRCMFCRRLMATDHEVVNAMLILGGNFLQHLAKAWCAADAVNQQRIKEAFADEWRHYAELSERLQEPR